MAQQLVGPGYIYVTPHPVQFSLVSGSSVAVCLYDPKNRIGGINHFPYPLIRDPKKATAMFGNAATAALVRMMLDQGGKRRRMEAQILGGAFNPELSERDIGLENVDVARRVLSSRRIQIVSEDVGGSRGRKVVFNTETGEVAVFKAVQLRRSDWFPYEGDR